MPIYLGRRSSRQPFPGLISPEASGLFVFGVLFGLTTDGPAEQLEPVTYQLISEFASHASLQIFNSLVLELDHFPRFNIDKMIMMFVRGLFVSCAAIAEIETFQKPRFLEQADRTINRRDADLRIDFRRPAIKLFDVRMIHRFRENPCDYAPLTGHFHSLVGAQLLEP